MATLLRLTATKTTRLFTINNLPKKRIIQPCCYISTSKKNKDSLTVTTDSADALRETEEFKKLKEHFSDIDPLKPKNWVSYGFSHTDRDSDIWMKNIVMFFVVTCSFVFGMTFFAYLPDLKLKRWAQREAYLEMERRTREGLPLVDPNLVDPATIQLPADEEVEDEDIII